ncbi:MAG: hypothetical protein R3F11_00070 [Verrucomicrobiales bacterium]
MTYLRPISLDQPTFAEEMDYDYLYRSSGPESLQVASDDLPVADSSDGSNIEGEGGDLLPTGTLAFQALIMRQKDRDFPVLLK